ncbi:hypothetical protein FQN49_005071 [Arthroderma sp. PD_2]|nr:hypothetical protein FQN49_005071 [Arthroderma sp. PD_2]
MGHHIDRRKHWRGPEHRMEDLVERENVEGIPNEDHELNSKRALPPTTTVVLTVIEAVLPDGSTAAQFTVPTLPATVSHSSLGVVTIPAGSMSPIIVSSLPPPQTKVPAPSPTTGPISASQPPPSQPSKPSTDVSLPSSNNSKPSTDVSRPSSQHSLPSTHNPLPSSQHTKPSSDVSTIPTTPSASTSVLPAPSSKSSISSDTDSSESSISSTPHSSSPTTASGSTSSSSSQISSATSSISTTLSTTFSSFSTSLSSSSSSSSTPSTSLQSTSTSTSSESGFIPGGGGGGATGGEPPAPTQSDGITPKASSSDDVPKIVGGIVGGVGGIVLIIILLLLLRRARKRKPVQESRLTGGIVSSGASAGRNTFSTSDTSQLSGSVLGGATRVFDRFRTSTGSMAAEPVPTQRGFQKLGGRKLTSVLETGGDGYDDKFGTDEKRLIASPESAGFGKETGSRSTAVAGGAGALGGGLHKELGLGQERSHSPSTSPMDRPLSDESAYSERVAFRPSPARTPVATPVESAMRGGITTTPQSGIVAPSEPLPTAIPPSVRDGIGRSLAAADGSRASRFTEGV